MNDLFHNAWEIRHGAATGLREVVKLHGRGAGRATDTPVDQVRFIRLFNNIWLKIYFCICCLILDLNKQFKRKGYSSFIIIIII